MRDPTPSEQSKAADLAADSRVTDPKRRRFLFTLGAGSAGAAAAVAGTVAGSAAAQLVAAPAADAESGYRETEHVRDYYRSAKI